MKPTDIIIIAVVALIIGAALAYIIISKKRGRKCIGCPDGANCSKNKIGTYACSGSCSSCNACSGVKQNTKCEDEASHKQ